jgi:hypothetical protein
LLPFDGIANYYGPILTPRDAQDYLEALLTTIPWKNDEEVICGTYIVTARKVAWYGDSSYSMITIRRLCDVRKDVISLRRVLMQAATEQPGSKADIDRLSDSLTECDHVCNQVNSHVAHTANPQRAQNFVKWDMEMQLLEDAHKVICRAAIVLERDILRIQNRIELMTVPQYDVMEDLRLWILDEIVDQLYRLWHEHRKKVNSWMREL